jgi:hypothetical protein
MLAIVIGCSFGAAAQNHARYSNVKSTWRDIGLERDAITLANKQASTIRCQEYYLDAKIVSDSWELVEDEYGRIIGRYIHLELLGETKRGECGMAHCIFRQKYEGDDTFSPRLRLVELGEFYSIECE